MLARAEARRVYDAALESHNERTRNTPKRSTCSQGLIFIVKPSVPPLRGPGGGLVVARAEKVSLLGSQFDRKQCREQFVTPLICFSQSTCNFWPSELLCFCVCFLILTHMVVLILWVCFLYF